MINKVLTVRIGKVLSKIINLSPSIFVLRRRIVDNILLTNELARNYNMRVFFSGRKGVRQGDSMSLMLFEVAIEYFFMLVITKLPTEFKFHKNYNMVKLIHLCFV